MAFTYDPSTQRGEVRLGIGDTSDAHPLFTDQEIDLAITRGVTTTGAIVLLLRTLKAAAAIRGESARVSAIDEVIASYNEMPEVTVTEPAAQPFDRCWIYGD